MSSIGIFDGGKASDVAAANAKEADFHSDNEECDEDHNEVNCDDQENGDLNARPEIQQFIKEIYYSKRYNDAINEYRHVIFPKEYYSRHVPESHKNRLSLIST